MRGENESCNPPTYLHPHTTSAELPGQHAPAKAIDVAKRHTIVIALVYIRGEGKNANVLLEEKRNIVFSGQSDPRRAETTTVRAPGKCLHQSRTEKPENGKRNELRSGLGVRRGLGSN